MKAQKTYSNHEQIRKKHLSYAASKGISAYFHICLTRFLDNLRELFLVKNLCVLNEILLQTAVCSRPIRMAKVT